MQVLEGQPNGSGRQIAIAVSRFNELVTERLLEGARSTLERQGVSGDSIVVAWTPGAFELPWTCRMLAESGRFSAVIALGAVIRGATPHFDHVCTQAARGVLDVSLATKTPVLFGVLTCDNLEQALERAGSDAGNKGAECAMAALEMIELGERIREL